MATPFFRGNYGSALSRVDTRPIMEAGRATGQMYAGLGKEVGGMIQQYGLNKEKRRKEEDTAMGTLAGFTPEELMQIGQDNPKLGKAIERATTEGATPRDFQLINASAAPIVAGKMRQLQTDATSALTESRELANRLTKERDENINSAFTALEKTRDEVSNMVKDGVLSAENLTPAMRRLLNNPEILASRSPSALNFFSSDPTADERAQQQVKLGDLAIEGAERSKLEADLLVEAFGGEKEKAEFEYQGEKLKRKVIQQGIEFSKKRGMYYDALRNPSVPVDTQKQYAKIQSDIGVLSKTLVKDPDTGKQIPFGEYMDLAADDESQYSLKGNDPAGRLFGRLQTLQREADELLKGTQVTVDDRTGTTDEVAVRGTSTNVSRMSPSQAIETLQKRISDLQNQESDIQAQMEQLGQPDQTMPVQRMPLGASPGFSAPIYAQTDFVPQSVQFIEQNKEELNKQELQRQADLVEAQRQLQELQSQFGR